MKLRAIGTGSSYCRHPLVPASFLIQTEGSNILIGCPYQIPAKLETLGIPLEKIDMIIVLNASAAQTGGLDEIGYFFEARPNKPYLACPDELLQRVQARLEHPKGFQGKAITKVGLKEEHFSETFTFVSNYNHGYGFRLEESKIFYSGSAPVNEDWLFKEMACEMIIHDQREELQSLPLYLQNKIWITAYTKIEDGPDPLPMLFIPNLSWIFDSNRRDKALTKERFLRENTRRVMGNEGSR